MPGTCQLPENYQLPTLDQHSFGKKISLPNICICHLPQSGFLFTRIFTMYIVSLKKKKNPQKAETQGGKKHNIFLTSPFLVGSSEFPCSFEMLRLYMSAYNGVSYRSLQSTTESALSQPDLFSRIFNRTGKHISLFLHSPELVMFPDN